MYVVEKVWEEDSMRGWEGKGRQLKGNRKKREGSVRVSSVPRRYQGSKMWPNSNVFLLTAVFDIKLGGSI